MKRISTGIENFKELLDNNYYYVDKTKLIEDVLSDKVMLYTRPRRFGKTLNMSMLYYFFSNKEKENAYLFDGLYISKQQEAKSYQIYFKTTGSKKLSKPISCYLFKFKRYAVFEYGRTRKEICRNNQ